MPRERFGIGNLPCKLDSLQRDLEIWIETGVSVAMNQVVQSAYSPTGLPR